MTTITPKQTLLFEAIDEVERCPSCGNAMRWDERDPYVCRCDDLDRYDDYDGSWDFYPEHDDDGEEDE